MLRDGAPGLPLLLPQNGLRTEVGPHCTKRRARAVRRWSSCLSRPGPRWMRRRTTARGLCFFFGDRLVNFVRSQRVSVCDDLFLHIQRTKSLLRGLPISIDIGYSCGISLDCGESHLLTMFIFFAHDFHRRFSRCFSC